MAIEKRNTPGEPPIQRGKDIECGCVGIPKGMRRERYLPFNDAVKQVKESSPLAERYLKRRKFTIQGEQGEEEVIVDPPIKKILAKIAALTKIPEHALQVRSAIGTSLDIDHGIDAIIFDRRDITVFIDITSNPEKAALGAKGKDDMIIILEIGIGEGGNLVLTDEEIERVAKLAAKQFSQAPKY